jgi:hypothetical protein
VEVYGVSPSLFDVTIPGFLKVSKYYGNTSLLDSLYTRVGSHSMIVGSMYEESLEIDLGDHFLLKTSERIEQDEQSIGSGAFSYHR